MPELKASLQQPDSRLLTGLHRLGVPDAGLHLADVGAAQHQHTQPGLADAAADGQGQFPVQQHLMERKLPPLVASGLGQLPVKRLGIYPDAHGRNLQSPAKGLVPEENIAVQIPVVVVRSPAVVGLSGAELAADLHDAGGFVLAHIGVFPLGAGGQLGVQVFQLLGGDEADLPTQLCAQLGVADVESVVGGADGLDDGPDNQLQEIQIPVFRGDDLLPVPLVHVDGVDVVQFLVPADGVHIGVQAVAHGEMIPLQSQPLPLGQGVHHLGISSYRGDVEGNRTLIAVQVVVQAGVFGDEQGSGDPLQIQRVGELILEGGFDVGDGSLGVVGVQLGGVALGNKDLIHVISAFLARLLLL